MRNLYTLTFYARKINAIGILCLFTETIAAASEQDAIRSLYDHYDHVNVVKISIL